MDIVDYIINRYTLGLHMGLSYNSAWQAYIAILFKHYTCTLEGGNIQ